MRNVVPAITQVLLGGVLATIVSTAAVAQEQAPSTSNVSYGGFIDASYLRAFNDPLNQQFRSRGTTWHLNDPFVNMAAFYVKKKATDASRWGVEIEGQSGKDDEIFGFSATAPNVRGADALRHVGLANVSYLAPAGKGLSVQGGIFGSLIGYDSLYAKDNLNYTRPWGADFTPYLMLGVNASYPLSDKLTGTVAIVNGYWHLAHANDVPSSVLQFAYAVSPSVSVKNTTLYGPHQSNTALEYWRLINDTIVERRRGRFVIAFEEHVAEERVADPANARAWWLAAQLPMRWNVHGPWSVALRPEVARDTAGRWTLAEQTVAAVTTTLEYKVTSATGAGATVRIEHRFDRSTGAQGGFFADHESAPGVVALTPNQHLLAVAAIFTFDRTR